MILIIYDSELSPISKSFLHSSLKCNSVIFYVGSYFIFFNIRLSDPFIELYCHSCLHYILMYHSIVANFSEVSFHVLKLQKENPSTKYKCALYLFLLHTKLLKKNLVQIGGKKNKESNDYFSNKRIYVNEKLDFFLDNSII